MGGIGIEEAAAVGAKLLDGFLAGDGTHCDCLLDAFQSCCVNRAQKGLRHAKQP